jgi:hypothetical protein
MIIESGDTFPEKISTAKIKPIGCPGQNQAASPPLFSRPGTLVCQSGKTERIAKKPEHCRRVFAGLANFREVQPLFRGTRSHAPDTLSKGSFCHGSAHL